MTEQKGPESNSADQPESQPSPPAPPSYGPPSQTPTSYHAGPPSFDKDPQQHSAQAYPAQAGQHLPPAPAGHHYAVPDEPNAQTSLIVGVLGLLLGFTCGVGFLASPFALVMGWKSKKRIAESGGTLGGQSNAQAGFILGIVGTVILALLVIAVFFLILILILVVDWSTNSTPSIGIAT